MRCCAISIAWKSSVLTFGWTFMLFKMYCEPHALLLLMRSLCVCALRTLNRIIFALRDFFFFYQTCEHHNVINVQTESNALKFIYTKPIETVEIHLNDCVCVSKMCFIFGGSNFTGNWQHVWRVNSAWLKLIISILWNMHELLISDIEKPRGSDYIHYATIL